MYNVEPWHEYIFWAPVQHQQKDDLIIILRLARHPLQSTPEQYSRLSHLEQIVSSSTNFKTLCEKIREQVFNPNHHFNHVTRLKLLDWLLRAGECIPLPLPG